MVTFTLTGADFDKGTGWNPAMFYNGGGTITTLTLQPLVDSNPNVLRFRVANAGTNVTTGANWRITGLQYVTSSFGPANATVDMKVLVTDTSGVLTIDFANPAATNHTLSVLQQFTAATTPVAPLFTAVVDVNQNRLGFLDTPTGTNQKTSDGIDAGYGDFGGGITYLVQPLTSTDWTLHGDFSALDANGDGAWTAADGTTVNIGAVAGYGCFGGIPVGFSALAADFQSIAINVAAPATTLGSVCVNFTSANAITLTPQSFTLDAVANYAATSTKSIYTGMAAGAWTLNGSSIVIPYMPYGNSISQIIYVNNSSTVDGAINLSYIWQDGTTGSATLSSVATGGTITKLAGDVKAVLDAAGLTSGKAELTLTVNAPASKVRAYTAYNVNTTGGKGNRVTVPNSSVDSGTGL